MKRILWLIAYIGIVWYFGGADAVKMRLLVASVGLAVFAIVWFTRRGRLGTPVPSLSLSERALEDAQRERG